MRCTWIKFVFVVAAAWWAYLFFTTEMVVVYDSQGYEDTGRMIAHQGLSEYLRHGPQREPMFPCLVAISMRIGECFGISYFYPLKLIGLSFLFLTMLFSYHLMRYMRIRPMIAGLIILYMGISPVMTNSSIRLWSEFAAYPWVVLSVIWSIKSWKALDEITPDVQGYLKMAGHAGMVALMFLLVMSVKAVAEGVLLFYLWPFYGRAFLEWRRGFRRRAKYVAIFVLMVLGVFEGAVLSYKWANLHYNGQFTFTNRGDWAFYGNTARRMQPLSSQSLEAAMVYVPGMGLCSSHFSQAECEFWSADYSDNLISEKRVELSRQGIQGEAASKAFVKSAIDSITANPFQAALLMTVEAYKMFFWESSLDFVTYPDWLDQVFHNAALVYPLRWILAVLSWIACIFACIYLCFFRRSKSSEDLDKNQSVLWSVNFIFWYMAMYSLFYILDRYSFPLIALFLVLIAFLLNQLSLLFFSMGPQDATPKVSKFYPGWIILGIFLLSLCSGPINPLVAHIIKEHQIVEKKNKFVTLSYSSPYFGYLSNMVQGNTPPARAVLQANYEDYYKQAVNLFPQDAASHYSLGFCEYYKGHQIQAQAEFEKSLEINQSFFWVYYNLAIIYLDEAQDMKAAILLNKALSLDKMSTFEDLRQSPLYAQTWANLSNPQQTLVANFQGGLQDAALLLVVSMVKAGQYDQAVSVIQSIGEGNIAHQGLWQQLKQNARSHQPFTSSFERLLKTQVMVRLF